MNSQLFTFFYLGVPAFPCCGLPMPSVFSCNSSALFVFLLVDKVASKSLFLAYKKYKKKLRHLRFRPHAAPARIPSRGSESLRVVLQFKILKNTNSIQQTFFTSIIRSTTIFIIFCSKNNSFFNWIVMNVTNFLLNYLVTP